MANDDRPTQANPPPTKITTTGPYAAELLPPAQYDQPPLPPQRPRQQQQHRRPAQVRPFRIPFVDQLIAWLVVFALFWLIVVLGFTFILLGQKTGYLKYPIQLAPTPAATATHHKHHH